MEKCYAKSKKKKKRCMQKVSMCAKSMCSSAVCVWKQERTKANAQYRARYIHL